MANERLPATIERADIDGMAASAAAGVVVHVTERLSMGLGYRWANSIDVSGEWYGEDAEGTSRTQSVALAAPPDGPATDGAFLCPAVGDGVANADSHNGDHGVSVIGPIASGWSFLPGNNQAGAHANDNAWNSEGPASSPGPGNANSDWSPIWPDPAA